MEIVTAIAGRLWIMSFQACALILIVLAVRICLKKFPKSYSYFLWALVGARLLCPVFVEASFSLQPEIWDFSGVMQSLDNTNPKDASQLPGNQQNAALGSSEGLSADGKEPGNQDVPEGRREEDRPDPYTMAQVAAARCERNCSHIHHYHTMATA